MIGTIHFKVPVTNSTSLQVSKNIDSCDKLLYYLYLSSIALPDEGDINFHYFSFREKKEYKLNDNFKIIMYESEFLFVYDIDRNNFELELPGGIYILKCHTTQDEDIIINGNDLIYTDKTIDTYYKLENGVTFKCSQNHMLININEIRPNSIDLHFYSQSTDNLNLKLIAHIDKKYFVNWYETNILNDIIYYNTMYPVECNMDDIAISIDAKNCFAVSENANIIDVHLSRYYNPQIIYDNNVKLLPDKTLLDVFYNYLEDKIYLHFFEKPIIRSDFFDYVYNINDLQCVNFLNVIGKVDDLSPIYFLRRIPGLKYLKYFIAYTGECNPTENLLYLNYLNRFNHYFINFDIMTIQDDFVCTRFRKKDCINTIVPIVSNVYLPIISITINYNDARYSNSYLFFELEFDVFHYIFSILSAEVTNFSLWDNNIEQSAKFLINSMSYSESPIYKLYDQINLFPKKIHKYFQNFVYFKTCRLDEFIIDLPEWTSSLVLLKKSADNYNISINDIEYNNETEQCISHDKFPTLLYTSYMLSDNKRDIYRPSFEEFQDLKNSLINNINPADLSINLNSNLKFKSDKLIFIDNLQDETLTIRNPSQNDWILFLLGNKDV